MRSRRIRDMPCQVSMGGEYRLLPDLYARKVLWASKYLCDDADISDNMRPEAIQWLYAMCRVPEFALLRTLEDFQSALPRISTGSEKQSVRGSESWEILQITQEHCGTLRFKYGVLEQLVDFCLDKMAQFWKSWWECSDSLCALPKIPGWLSFKEGIQAFLRIMGEYDKKRQEVSKISPDAETGSDSSMESTLPTKLETIKDGTAFTISLNESQAGNTASTASNATSASCLHRISRRDVS